MYPTINRKKIVVIISLFAAILTVGCGRAEVREETSVEAEEVASSQDMDVVLSEETGLMEEKEESIITALPSEVGIHDECLSLIEDIIETDIKHGFTSAQLSIIKDNKLVYENAWGKVNVDSDKEVTTDTLYDLASLTKMFAVNYALQKLVTDGDISLDERATDYLGDRFADDVIDIHYTKGDNPDLETQREWKRGLTIKDLLMHQGGFPADPKYCDPFVDTEEQEHDPDKTNLLYAGNGADEATRQATIEAICKTPLLYKPGSRTVYSDVDYMILGLIVEDVTGTNLDTYLKQTFCEPMGLSHITYMPLENGFSKDDCAATELHGNTRDGAVYFDGIRTYTLQGEVHDEKAYYSMGGISGHAGLFSNATDLARLANLMLTGECEGTVFFSKKVINEFTKAKSEEYQNWGLGWWRQGDMQRTKYFGTGAESDTFGHQGWTGTLIMIDPDRNLVVAFLTNKINSPVTDIEKDPNMFDGGWYTTAALGFAPDILYVGMDEDTDVTGELLSIIKRLADEAGAQVSADMPSDHPARRNLESKLEILSRME